MTPEPRTERLEVRISPLEKALIAERALEAGQKVSDYVRDRALCRPPSNEGAKQEHPPAVAAEIAEAKLEDGPAREAFLQRRTQQLIGQGRTSPVARREAEREWEERGAGGG